MKTENKIKVTERLAKKIYKLSEETNKNASYHTNKAIENYLEEFEELKEASKRLHNKNDKVISSKELRKSLGI